MGGMIKPKTPGDHQPLTVDARDASQLLGISRAQLYKLHSSGRLPLPVHLGVRAPRWVIAELQEWLASGAPPRDQWERLKREGGR
jgi:predicted DNA-binding transcriptional regulator AlpA